MSVPAQADMLRFINVRLANRQQVLYTTHSPFMVLPEQLGIEDMRGLREERDLPLRYGL